MNNPRWQDTATDIIQQLGIILSAEQQDVFFDDGRIKVVCGGEGSSKSFLGALYAICRSKHDALLAEHLQERFGNLYWIVGHDFETARREFGSIGQEEMLVSWMGALLDVNWSYTSVPARYDIPCVLQTKQHGQVFRTISGYDPKKIGREEPTGIIGCEVSLWEEEIWNRCYGRLARMYPYSWGWFSGSPESNAGWFDDLVGLGDHENSLDIRSYHLPSWANPVVYPGGRQDPAIVQLEESMSYDRFMRRHGGIITAATDAVLPEFNAAVHVADIVLRPDLPVHLAIDPGHLVYAVLALQVDAGCIRVVDSIYVSKWSHEQIIQEAQNRPWWKQVGGGNHVMDIAGTQHHDGDLPTVESWRRDTGLRFIVKKRAVDDVVERLRSLLTISSITGKPRLLINRHCTGLLAEMGKGKSPVEGIHVWKMKGGKPAQESDHACKALGYWALHVYGTTRPESAADVDYADEPGNSLVSSYLTDGSKDDPFEALLARSVR